MQASNKNNNQTQVAGGVVFIVDAQYIICVITKLKELL